jgi:phospho-N-acetylmuramoyl-pentapeptide-transferase
MIYHLLVPLAAQFTLFNVFRYITFRSVYALLTALVISVLFGPRLIEWLKALRCRQHILQEVTCHQAKEGTPTMGGLIIAAALVPSVLLWADLSNVYIWLTLLVFLGFGAVGVWDDYTKVVKKQNKGFRPAPSGRPAFGGGRGHHPAAVPPAYSTMLSVPFSNTSPQPGALLRALRRAGAGAASNAVNLTDGLDGLAIGPVVVSAACFALFIYAAGNAVIAQYLNITPVPGVGEVTVFCGALVGAGLGFLWFNAYPAQVFMGDVGSLSLGGTLGFISVLAKQELILALVGGVFVFETLSVILQVGYFKMTGGKRFFRMAPLHHHFELKGIPESKIIIRFWILSILMALMALSTLKLR